MLLDYGQEAKNARNSKRKLGIRIKSQAIKKQANFKSQITNLK
jgi:hypothetical protein